MDYPSTCGAMFVTCPGASRLQLEVQASSWWCGTSARCVLSRTGMLTKRRLAVMLAVQGKGSHSASAMAT
eukprot:2520035-Prymnesium_polylepis.1